MPNITETITYDANIPSVTTTDQVLGGGDSAPANKQAKALADRTAYLKFWLDKGIRFSGVTTSIFNGSPSTINVALADAGKIFVIGNFALTTINLMDTSAYVSIGFESFTFNNLLGTADALITIPSYPTSQIASYGQSIRLRAGDSVRIMIYANGAYVVSDFYQASRLSIPGEVKKLAFNTVPDGYLACNGAAVSRTTYADLFANVGTTWGIGDGSTTFNLPDYRGEFLRGIDNGRGVDTGRTFGAAQASDIAPHTHAVGIRISSTTTVGGNSIVGDNGSSQANINTLNGGIGIGTETRPRNQTVLYVIKF